MLYIVLNILCAVGMYLILKMNAHYKANSIQTLLFNYIFAFVVSIASCNIGDNIETISRSGFWFPAIMLGSIFMLTFWIVAISTKEVGMGLTTAASKMSLLIPVFIGLFVYGQTQNWGWKVLGLLLAIFAFLLIFSKKAEIKITSKYILLLPLIVFICSGISDSVLDYGQRFCAPSPDLKQLFLCIVFGVAAIVALIMAMGEVIIHKQKFSWKSLVLGLALGLANFFTTLLMLQNMSDFGSSVFFPIFNASTVVIVTLIGALVFKEKLSRNQIIGIAVAAVSVIIVAAVA